MEKILQDIIKYWDDYSDKFDEDHNTENKEEWKKILKEYLGENKNIKVLDLGTGTGFLANMIGQLGYESIGMDMSNQMMELGRKYAAELGSNVKFIFGNVDDTGLEKNSIDAITNCRLVWTLTDPQKSFTEWKRILKDGGVLLNFIRININGEKKIGSVYGDDIDQKLPLKNASGELLVSELEKAGFKNVSAIQLPKELTYKEEYDPWFVIRGYKN